jgi:type I restriction enzyme S subunit
MKKYDSYKDSGIEWIGDIPKHWETSKVKFLFETQKGKTPGNLLDKMEDNSQVYLAMDYLRGEPKQVFFVSINENVVLTEENETLLLWDGSNAGEFLKSKKGVLSSTMALIKSKIIDNQFQWYSFKSFESILKDSCNGMGIPHVDGKFFRGSAFLVPPIEEQTAIAKYLDNKTTQIDNLIAKKEQFIQLLEEERVAVINQAVTKGLDPNVPMKDSGIEWLGEIPEHWEVKKLKFLLKETKDSLKTGPFGSHIKNSDYIPNGNYKVYTQRNVLDNEYEIGFECISDEKYDELKGFTIYEGDVLITTRGSIGRCSVFPNNMSIGILHPCLIRIQVNENRCLRNWIVNYINNTSLFYNNVKFNSNSTIIDVIYGYTLKEIFFPTPPIDEQHTILDFLSCTISDIDIIISKTQQEIELLKEYKTALISEVVTGKVDVRNEKLN